MIALIELGNDGCSFGDVAFVDFQANAPYGVAVKRENAYHGLILKNMWYFLLF